MEERLHPELKNMFSVLPEVVYTRENLAAKRKEMQEFVAGMTASLPVNDAVLTSERYIPGAAGDPDVRIKMYEPRVKNGPLPGVLYIHGGGYILGSADMMDPALQQMVSELECVIVSVDYRLAPEHPFPAPLEDCYAALQWFSENAEELGSDSSRIAVVGPSAGGGLTAAVSLLARDRNGPSILFQMPLYPMLDDRHMTKSSNEITDDRVWSRAKNQLGWEMYLGDEGEVSQYAAPARATDLSGLPPMYTCVGDLDPFRDETIDYVLRLTQAGVPTEFHLYPGCFHGFEEYFPSAEISQRVIKEYHAALKRALYRAL
ncbi:alpha/beta hydrolase [Paenibacillus sp. P96]|uniref:Alpha/beta hydrolase n=1 Tax=Paenibacillus zeirhizosphaerae TaxID=2987519 RepID=A0ABT9FKT9_9BACL|nr:alpha/beta hydrolase [Paenibacillus sp. P96]MDP4095347.1 alpha/beta hydrolase [Paenibacillus sp. P96]